MHHARHIIRKVTLYVSSIVLIGAAPMTAFADDSDACAGTGHWSDRWETDPTTNQCVKLYDSNGTFVGPSYMAPQPSPSPTPSPSPEPSPSSQATAPSTTTTPQTTVQDTGNGNTTGADSTTNGTATTNTDNTTNVKSGTQSTATSGSAEVQGNTSTGSATSGDASTNGTVVNSVHSTTAGGSGVATFTYDVNGNVVGDITLNGSGDQAKTSSTTNLNGTTNVNNKTNLDNDVDLNATSGDATIQGNESTGSATSGNANAVANILNLINTIIAANQSFIGTINIYGNLDGDILLSPEFIPQLIASNSGNVISSSNLALTTNVNDNNTIVNNVKLSAASGNATVSGAESKGSATTGTGQTNLTILNLTGHQVTAANSLLVFVNVLGTWVGMIVDAPGATAAMLGNGVVSDTTTNISNTANLANSSMITNNVTVAAKTGNTLVDGNESSGNATSGNATASANIANISTSTFNLTGWFGVLYINVFGKWLGSFGINTAAGTIQPLTGMAVPDAAPTTIAAPNVRFGFTPRDNDISSASMGGVTAANNSNDDSYRAAVMASAIASKKSGPLAPQSLTPIASPRADPFSVVLMIGGFGVAGTSATLWAIRRLLEARSV